MISWLVGCIATGRVCFVCLWEGTLKAEVWVGQAGTHKGRQRGKSQWDRLVAFEAARQGRLQLLRQAQA